MTTITANSNPKVKWVRRLQAQRSARHAEGHFVIEGARLLGEALKAGAQVPLVLHLESPDADTRNLLDGFAALGAQVMPVTSEIIELCSDTETPQGLLAVVKVSESPIPPQSEPLLIVDRVRDPGNLGTLMRSSLASRIALMLLTPGTVDPLNPKVVRGAMGAHFHLPFKSISIEELGDYVQGKTLWIAEAHSGVRYDYVDWTQPSALLIGGEASGPSEDVRQFTFKHVHIPISPVAESLNAAVAGSVLMFEMARQRGFK
ncbi:MAG: RNA methyltransferase [Anaerolineales bacterium]|jgi:TrmH family RNA methyltransferase